MWTLSYSVFLLFLIFSIVFIKIELNEFWWFFCKKKIVVLVTYDDYTFRKNENMPEVFPPTKIFIMKSDVKKINYSISIDHTPF